MAIPVAPGCCFLYPAAMIEILPETPARDGAAIEALFDLTFGPGHFARTAERLREFSRSLPAISRVAREGDVLIGVCRVWPVRIAATPALFYGPVAVHPDYRGGRLGLSVTRSALDAGAAAGWPAALLIGAPAYFAEAGFTVAARGTLRMPGPQDAGRIMLRALAGNAGDIRGDVNAAPDLASSASLAPPGPDQDGNQRQCGGKAGQERGRA